MTWTLHHGDCLDPVSGLESLADKSVDHVICDPPYEIEAHTKARRAAPGSNRNACAKDGNIVDYEINFEAITEDVRSAVAKQSARVAKGWVLAFCQAEGVVPWRRAFEAAGMKWRRTAIWVKPDSAPQFTGDRPAQAFECMALAWAGSGRSVWNGGGKRGLYTALVNDFGRRTGGRPHPTQKPLDLMRELVEDFTRPGDLVLDPFAGSGTTGVACNQLGRHFIGWERDANYHAIATRRLRGDEAKPREAQPSLFGSLGGDR